MPAASGSVRRRTVSSQSSFLLAFSLFAGTISLFWLGYRATVEWDASTQQLVRSRAGEMLALVSVAIDRDMKGGQLDLLLPMNGVVLERSSLYDLADRFSGALARFPYIESVFVWRSSRSGARRLFFFNRSERLPPWDAESQSADWYPVVVRSDPTPPMTVVAASRRPADSGTPFSLVEGVIDGTPYQVIAHGILDDDGSLDAVVGFTVNLSWVREHYFGPLLEQIQHVGGDASVRLEVRDDAGALVAATGPSASGKALAPHSFPLLFAQPSLASGIAATPAGLWSARVDVATDATLIASRRSTVRTLTLLSGAVVATVVALLLAVRSARAAAALTARQADFVSVVSHEMKTPLSLITLASDSLASGRCATVDAARDHGRLLAQEARQLSLLIDNVLCYARLVDEEDSRTLESIDLADLLGESIERFRVQCAEIGCEMQMSSVLTREIVNADRRLLRDAFDNIVDNAIKYGGKGGRIVISIRAEGQIIHVAVTDYGQGIAAEDLPHVFEKFRRGSKVAHSHRGSGLGLTIARRVIEAHRGRISLRSQPGQGTTVHIELPAA